MTVRESVRPLLPATMLNVGVILVTPVMFEAKALIGVPGGGLADHIEALAAVDAALAGDGDDATEMPPHLARAKASYTRYLGWARAEVGKILRAR